MKKSTFIPMSTSLVSWRCLGYSRQAIHARHSVSNLQHHVETNLSLAPLRQGLQAARPLLLARRWRGVGRDVVVFVQRKAHLLSSSLLRRRARCIGRRGSRVELLGAGVRTGKLPKVGLYLKTQTDLWLLPFLGFQQFYPQECFFFPLTANSLFEVVNF